MNEQIFIRGNMIFSTSLKPFSVGNRIIDSEHQQLVNVINDIGQLILVNHAEALSEAFNILDNMLRTYFVVEESVALAVKFDFARHRLAHQDLLKNFQTIRARLMNQDCKWSTSERKDGVDSLNQYLIQHITEDSKPLKIVLDTYLYDFQPG